MFWRLGFHHRSPIENILDKQDPQLEEILDEEDIIQECKSASDKLIDFLSRPEVISKMIEFITVEVPNADEKRKLKYPFLSCEILCCDIGSVLDRFSESPAMWKQFFGFLDNPAPLNPVLAAYFLKFATTLLQKKTQEVMEFVQGSNTTPSDVDDNSKTQNKLVSNLATHVGTYGMGELILRLLGCDMSMDASSDPFGASGIGMSFANQLKLRMFDSKKAKENRLDAEKISQWWLDNRVIELLVEKLDPEFDSEVHNNVCGLLSDIIKRFVPPQPTILSDKLKSEEVVRQILNNVLKNPGSSVLSEGLGLLSTIVQSAVNPAVNVSKSDKPPRQIEVIMERIQEFVNLLHEPPQMGSIETTTCNVLETPVGETRLRIVSFLALLFQTKYHIIEQELMAKNVLSSFLDLFFNYPNNNLLHHQVEQVITEIMVAPNDDIKSALFKEGRLLERMAEAIKANEKDLAQPKGMRRGYMGHITLISNNIARIMNTSQVVSDIVTAVNEWKEIDAYVSDANKADYTAIGGPTPLSRSLDEDIFEYSNSWSNNAQEEEENQDFDDDITKAKDELEQRDPEFDARHVFDDIDDGTFVKMEEDFDEWPEKDILEKSHGSSDTQITSGDMMEHTQTSVPSNTTESNVTNSEGNNWANFDSMDTTATNPTTDNSDVTNHN